MHFSVRFWNCVLWFSSAPFSNAMHSFDEDILLILFRPRVWFPYSSLIHIHFEPKALAWSLTRKWVCIKWLAVFNTKMRKEYPSAQKFWYFLEFIVCMLRRLKVIDVCNQLALNNRDIWVQRSPLRRAQGRRPTFNSNESGNRKTMMYRDRMVKGDDISMQTSQNWFLSDPSEKGAVNLLLHWNMECSDIQ